MNWFRRVMYGRYGIDQLSIALLILYMAMNFSANLTWNIPLRMVALIPLALCFYRVFSRNTGKRYRENQKFMGIWYSIKNRYIKMNRKLNDRQTHKYFKCPKCSNTLRVPRGKGKICITCPVCKTEFIKKT